MNAIPYFILIFFLGFLFFLEKVVLKGKAKKMVIFIAFLTVWIFVGFRGHIMSDFLVYYPYFNRYPDLFHLTSSSFFNRFEPGFNIYTAFIKIFTDNYFVWVAINTLIDFVVITWFFNKYSKSVLLSLIFFICFNGLAMEFNLYRNMKGIDLFFLSVPYLLDRKFLPYLLLNLLGMTFHTTSVMYIPVYFILTKEFPKWLIWGGFAVANMVYIFKIGVVGELMRHIPVMRALEAYDRVTNYVHAGKEIIFSVGYFERTISFLIFTYYLTKIKGNKIATKVFYNSYWIYYCTYLLFYEVAVFVDRIPILFVYSYWMLYPAVLMTRAKLQQLVRCFVVALALLKAYATYSPPDTKYENVITGISSFQTRKSIVRKVLRNQ